MKYKVGDKVRIKSIDWYNRYTNGTEVDCGAYPFTSDMKEFCEQERIIANVCRECYFLLGIDDRFAWTDEMIEGLVEEEIVPKFKVGDMICKVGGLSNGYLVTSVSDEYYGLQIENGVGVLPVVGQDEWVLLSVDGNDEENDFREVVDEHYFDMLGGESTKEFELPEGYEFRDEDGNVINTQKIVLEKKKKESPKTDDIIKWLRECELTKYIGVIYSGMCSITFDTEKLIKDITEIIGDE